MAACSEREEQGRFYVKSVVLEDLGPLAFDRPGQGGVAPTPSEHRPDAADAGGGLSASIVGGRRKAHDTGQSWEVSLAAMASPGLRRSRGTCSVRSSTGACTAPSIRELHAATLRDRPHAARRYIFTQVLGGWLATNFGGKWVFGIGVLGTAVLTIITPYVAREYPLWVFILVRILEGVGEGVTFPAMHGVWARWAPPMERSKLATMSYSGAYVGTIISMPLSGWLCASEYGWPSVFYLCGGFGVFWFVLWICLVHSDPSTHPRMSKAELDYIQGTLRAERPSGAKEPLLEGHHETPGNVPDDQGTPWKEIFTSSAVWAIVVGHICNNWGFYVLLAWLPTYFTDELGVTLTNASLLTLLPPLANVAMASVAGPTADRLIGSGMEITKVRKTMQAVAFMGPALAMGSAALVDQPVATVGLLTLGLSLGAFSYTGLYSNHQDLSPKYASILLGMTNTCGALPGVIGVPLTGYLIKETENWELSMFVPAMFFYFTGTLVFSKYGSGDRQAFTGQPMPEPGEIPPSCDGGGH